VNASLIAKRIGVLLCALDAPGKICYTRPIGKNIMRRLGLNDEKPNHRTLY
jgi:hypothetical protein